MSQKKEPLALPALRAHMGDWIYYICFMRFVDVVNFINIAEDIHDSEALGELLQRRLTSRSTEIKDYLLMQEQRFFNALVVGAYGGLPEWFEFEIDDIERLGSGSELTEHFSDTVGILKLSGQEKLFAIDGQHRIAGIREVLPERPEMGQEEVCVIVVPGVTAEHRNMDPAGFERTRRLFSTLNRYAKPVSKKDIIALDEDDIVAIVTRYLVEEYPLLKSRVSTNLGKSLPRTDNTNLTNIITLYDVMDLLLRDRGVREWKDFKRKRPSEEIGNDYIQKAIGIWDTLSQSFEPLRHLRNINESNSLEMYRSAIGGNLLFRPVGLLIIARTLRSLNESGLPFAEAARNVSQVPLELSEHPWVGLLWDNQNHRMMTESARQKAAERVLYYGAGGEVADIQALEAELAGLLNRLSSDVKIVRYATPD